MRPDHVRFAALALLCGGAVSGCLSGDEEYRQAVPTGAQVTIAVPSASGKTSGQSVAGVGVNIEGLVGQQSEYYQFTWAVSATVNGSALVLLGLLHLIVEQHPTSQTVNSRTWGPYTPGGLDPLTYQAVVTRVGPGEYSFAIEARPRASQSDADFLPLLDGTVHRGQLAGTGTGDMTLHFDNGRVLRPAQCEQGTVAYAFDNTTPSARLDVTFTGFANNNPRGIGCQSDDPRDATYHYDRSGDGAGDFVFDLKANLNRVQENKPALEEASVRSRWLATGEGRSDVRIGGGDVAADLKAANLAQDYVLASQCWDASFATVYETSTPPELKLVVTSGDASKCVFTSMQLP